MRVSARRDPLLFVYGTLRPFCRVPMARRLAACAEHVGEARAAGRLYDLGPYPGMLAAQRRGDWVCGDVFRLRSPRALLHALDRYEAGPPRGGWPRFERVACTVEIGRARRRAWLYLYRGSVLGCTRIRAGDYRAWCAQALDTPS